MQIALTRGYSTVIDDADWTLVARYKWHAAPTRSGIIYAQASTSRVEGKRKSIKMHSIIAGRKWVDHKDGDGLNNRRSNLRPTTRKQNRRNSKPNSDTLHGLKGVDFMKNRNKWRARIYIRKRRVALGCFLTAELAGRAYDEAALHYFGTFARLNYPVQP